MQCDFSGNVSVWNLFFRDIKRLGGNKYSINIKLYIILNSEILQFNSSVLPSSKGYISQYTPYVLYAQITHDINEVIISLRIVKIIYFLY